MIICQTEVDDCSQFSHYLNANKCTIQPYLIISSNSYVCISIPIWNWQLICEMFNDLLSYKNNAMAISVLWLRIHTGNKNTVIQISTGLQVLIHTRNIFILYARHFYNWIRDIWLKQSCDYKVICFIRDIQTWYIQFTRYV